MGSRTGLCSQAAPGDPTPVPHRVDGAPGCPFVPVTAHAPSVVREDEHGRSRRDYGSTPRRAGLSVRRLLVIAVLAVAMTTAVLAVPALGSVRGELDAINGWWAAAAVALEVASCVSFVFVFRAFFDTVTPDVARRVAWVEEGSGALLPGGGVTSYAIGGLILGREGLTVRDIVVRSGGLFWFTSAVNALALAIGTGLLVLSPHRGGPSRLVVLLPLAVAGPLALLIASAPALGRAGTANRGRGGSLIDGVAEAWRAAGRRSWRLLGALGYLFFDIAVLACLFRGLGYAVPFGALTLGYLVGYCATLIPIPGGIGVLEGGLTGALILYGTPPAKTVAVVLVYHAIAFWIPSLGGAIGYASLVRLKSQTARRSPRQAHRHRAHPAPLRAVSADGPRILAPTAEPPEADRGSDGSLASRHPQSSRSRAS
jgi:uncharacterized membrane protein YbhN (UPF0104 family)